MQRLGGFWLTKQGNRTLTQLPNAILLHRLPGVMAHPLCPLHWLLLLINKPSPPASSPAHLPPADNKPNLRTALKAPTLAQSPTRREMWIKSGNSCCSRLIGITWLGGLGLHSWNDLPCFVLRTASKAQRMLIKIIETPHICHMFPSHVGKWFGNHFGAAFYVCFHCTKTTHVLPFLLKNAWQLLLLRS